MHAQDEMPERVAIRFHVQSAGCQLDPFGRGHFWYAEPVTGRLGRGRELVVIYHDAQFVIRHVEQSTQLRLLQLVHNASGRIPQGVADTRLPNERRHTRNLLCPLSA